MSHIQKQKKSILWVIFLKRVHFFESYLKKGSNSLRQTQEIKGPILCVIFKKKVQFFGHISRKKGWFLWVVVTKMFNSVSRIFKKGSILRVILKKFQFFESYKKFNSLSHMQKKVQFLWVISKKSSIRWVIFKKSIFWFIFNKQNSPVIFFESIFESY